MISPAGNRGVWRNIRWIFAKGETGGNELVALSYPRNSPHSQSDPLMLPLQNMQ